MVINLNKIINGNLKAKLESLLDVPLQPLEVVNVSNALVDVNRFMEGYIPHMRRQEQAYKKADREDDFQTLLETFTSSDYMFPDIEKFTIEGYPELDDEIFNGIITFTS